ncbi:MAG: hypothetical protein KDJ26_05390 [Alphaproteobacteria bacterium]|nr:hypothetical protein [Alphaproteobacteria bacterium]MCB1551418.1 hypothetical protein [Alphaproteobacteria bacterium]MCB9985434.1 hypothetical protein [Micavibrio sp.]HRK98553.1 hypothetical protein [Alphaproteobacteria bacterium]
MTRFYILPLILASIIVLSSSAAEAGSKFFSLWWWESHWQNQDFIPYYANGTDPHNTQWDKTEWQPTDWITMSGGTGVDLVNRWYTAKIINRQYYDDGAPYLDVGINFYHLSGLDKRRVMDTVNYVYQITEKQPKMFFLKDPQTDKVIGYYGTDGLILQ